VATHYDVPVDVQDVVFPEISLTIERLPSFKPWRHALSRLSSFASLRLMRWDSALREIITFPGRPASVEASRWSGSSKVRIGAGTFLEPHTADPRPFVGFLYLDELRIGSERFAGDLLPGVGIVNYVAPVGG
jgi:hypothetical protein